MPGQSACPALGRGASVVAEVSRSRTLVELLVPTRQIALPAMRGGLPARDDRHVILETIAPQLTRPRRSEPGPDSADPFLPVARLGRDIEVVEAALPCPRLANIFAAEHVSSIAIIDPADPHRIGLVSRERFQLASAGTFGYGQALLTRRPVGDITDWEPMRVPPRAPLVEVVHAAMNRPVRQRLDDILIAGHVWGVVATTDLVRLLAQITVARAGAAIASPGEHPAP